MEPKIKDTFRMGDCYCTITEVSEKITVLLDPLNGSDSHREEWTKEQFLNNIEKAYDYCSEGELTKSEEKLLEDYLSLPNYY